MATSRPSSRPPTPSRPRCGTRLHRDPSGGAMTIPPPVPYAALMSSQDAFARPPGRWHRSVPAWPNWRIDVLPAVLIGAFQVGLTNVAGRHQVGHQQLDPLGGTLLAI